MISLNQFYLVVELILKPNLDWIEHIENYCDESSEAVEEYLTYNTNIGETTWQELDVHERLDLAQKEDFESLPMRSSNGGWYLTGWPNGFGNLRNRFLICNTVSSGVGL